jgi:rhodanese-related sulfurtransferase
MFACANIRSLDYLRQAAWLLFLALVPAVLTAFLHPYGAQDIDRLKPDEITWTQSRKDVRFTDALWIDARPATAYAAGHKPGALRLTEADWETLLEPVLDAWKPGRFVVVYCDSKSCTASAGVAARLRRELGAGDIFVLRGGWQAITP